MAWASCSRAAAIIAQDDVDQVFADIMYVALHRRQDDSSLLRAIFLFHLRLKIRDRLFHHPGGIEHRRQLHFACAEEFAHRLHAVEQHGINDVQRRVVGESVVQNLLQRLAARPIA